MIKDKGKIEVAQKVNETLTGTLDFEELARKVTNLVVNELGLQGAAVFRVDKKNQVLRACTFAIKGDANILRKIMKKPFGKLSVSLTHPTNLMARTASTGRIFKGPDLNSYTNPALNERITKAILKVSRTDHMLSLPMRLGHEITGALLLGKKGDDFTEAEIDSMKFFAKQLGLAMANVMAHERIIEQYKKSLEEKGKPKKKRPHIKFTLRITDDLEQYLNYKTVNTKKSKAEYVRDLLEGQMKEDKDFQQFDK